MIKLHIGCGKRNWPDWNNVDGGEFPHVLEHDVTLKYQPNNFIDYIYSSHLIAYFDWFTGSDLLQSWYNKLKPGGMLRIATPDFKKISYMHNSGLCTLDEVIGPMYGRMYLDHKLIFHQCVYDFETLKRVLSIVGFTDICLYDHRKTEHPNTGDRSDFFDDCSSAYLHGELISLNVQCVKPF